MLYVLYKKKGLGNFYICLFNKLPGFAFRSLNYFLYLNSIYLALIKKVYKYVVLKYSK